ncbi:DUF6499 domain-containing protein [Gammaproteobacteria bacterium]|nr:DUF6499 domain-containing protein [Gammaproteobacteria bacterium]
MKNYSVSAPMPDWKNPEDYKFVKDLRVDRLAWEFLRRNPEYVEYWKKLEPDLANQKENYQKQFILLRHGKEWHLDMLIDPNDDNPIHLRWLSVARPQIVGRAGPNRASPEDKTKIALVFDLTLAINRQLTDAKSILLAQREILRKSDEYQQLILSKRKADYSLYLRVLDAKKINKTYTEIANVLFPTGKAYTERGPEKVKEIFNQAKLIQDTNFYKLAMLAKL